MIYGMCSDNPRAMTDNALAGGISGIFSRLVSTPLDVIKIRFQLQEESISKSNGSSKYTGVIQSLRTIVQEESASALWKGTVPGVAMYFLFMSVQFYSVEITSRTMKEKLGYESLPQFKFIGGCFGGASATLVCHPLDVLRTRLVGQGQGEKKHYKSLVSALRLMYLEKGLRTFYRGLAPNLLVVVPQAGLLFGFHSLFSMSISSTAVCGGLAGMSSKTLTLPLDMVKKRLQIQGFEEARRSFGQVTKMSGTLDAFGKIFRQEGMLGFYKGALPGVLKTSLAAAVGFSVYEYTLELLNNEPYNHSRRY